MLFDKKQHEPLAGGGWDERLARYAISDIVDEALAEPSAIPGGLYDGPAGEAYALRVLGADAPADAFVERDTPGLIDGELGVALVAGDRARAERAARACLDAETNDICEGPAGALVAATLLDLDDVAGLAVERLWSTWTFDSKLRACTWGPQLGFAHGLAGNLYALLRAGGLQSPQHQRELLDRAVEALTRTGLEERGLLNWPVEPGAPNRTLRVQWCHGAPGLVCALARAPRRTELDAMLLAAGELIWTAGPLKKGGGLCHGTAGNGYAFLKLHRRTRDTKWLERARRFGMHAITQRKGERGLFTGDLGTALYLRACIDVTDAFPVLDAL